MPRLFVFVLAALSLADYLNTLTIHNQTSIDWQLSHEHMHNMCRWQPPKTLASDQSSSIVFCFASSMLSPGILAQGSMEFRDSSQTQVLVLDARVEKQKNAVDMEYLRIITASLESPLLTSIPKLSTNPQTIAIVTRSGQSSLTLIDPKHQTATVDNPSNE